MSRRVRGILFLDYVRMMRARKRTAWAEYLEPEDLPYLSQKIEPDQWYPMDTYERMGLAILQEVTAGHLDIVYHWGRHTVEGLRAAHPDLFVDGDIRETLMRFHTLRASLFDFPAVEVVSIRDGACRFLVHYGMSPKAEEAATGQFKGFMERTLEEAGARNIRIEIPLRSWEGDPVTTVIVRWSKE